tara:strand:+ start:37 stop:390 length:354 start_codon:yes stop_codon:yes gene_type:complete
MMSYNVDKCRFLIKNKVLEFKSEVDTVLKKDEIYIILILENEMKKTGEAYGSQNIFGVNAEGEIIWQVEAPTKDPVDLYTSLFEKEGAIKAYASSGGDCVLDPKTGKILKKVFRPFG